MRDWHQHRRSEGLGANLKGEIDGIPVIDWLGVPEDRIFALDLDRFCRIEQGVDSANQPAPPAVTVERIDQERADDIISKSEPAENEDTEMERRQRVLTRVLVEISRPYRLEVDDAAAARSMIIPPSCHK